ncbi:MAG TPA: hypothetical protein RMH99_20360 [Sandaracinaceae bacterium LLY-WYZ-13_1]|nr:hypothetical protein [Sandaracinaceae bacterium LLY-WYZ-13_1]
MKGAITLERGGDGEVVALEGEVLRAVLSRAFAPGAPVGMTVDAGDETVPVSAKTIRSVKRDDGRFDVRLRLVNLRREHRAALERL